MLSLAGCSGQNSLNRERSPHGIHPPSTFEHAGDDLDDAAVFEQLHQLSHPGATLDELQRAMDGYRHLEARVLEGKSPLSACQIRWRLARTMFLASEKVATVEEKKAWIQSGETDAQKVLENCKESVEGLYYAAVLKGRRAELSGNGFKALRLVREVLALGKKAAALDPAYDHAAPLRLLAMLYAKAPPWPASIGDIDLALETAERALEISDYPMNHLILAEVLIEDDDYSRARNELNAVLSAPVTGDWAKEGIQWRPYAEKLFQAIAEK